MASLNSWLSPEVMRALAWALIHSLWQCLGLAALAAVLMAFSRRPPLRYMIGVGALAVMLAVPVATFFLLMRPATPVQRVLSANPVPAFENAGPIPAIVPSLIGENAMGTLEQSTRIAPSLLPWLVAAWLAGVAFFSLRFAGGFILLAHKRRRCFAPEARILALCREIQDQLGLTRAIRYLECNWLQAPAVIGWLRPIVLLPVTALTGLSEAQLRAVIAHELAHIRRFDCLANLFQIFAETLLFYHPAIWWLNRRIRAERELCCDEIALEVCGDRLDYAKALTLMAEWEATPALAMAANRGPLAERLLHLFGRKSTSAGQRMIGLTASVLFLFAALACANALFGINYPIPKAQAKESLKAALAVGNQAVNKMREAIEAITPATPSQSPVAIRPVRVVTAPLKIANNSPFAIVTPSIEALHEPNDAPVIAGASNSQAAAAPTTTLAAPAESAESITVTATPLPGRPAVDEFIYSYPTENRGTAKIARWMLPICPVVAGVPPRYADFIVKRLVAIAQKSGAPVGAIPKCQHNIQILFTANPQEVGDNLRKNHAPFLGWFDNLNKADELAKVTHGIQAWYLTASVGGPDRLHIDNPRQDFLTGNNLTPNGTGFPVSYFLGRATTLYNVIIVADSSKLGDYEMGALADYIAMLALSQPKSFDACWEVPSITNLLSKNCDPSRKTATLSDNDAAFLHGLYKMTPESVIWAQRSQIRYFLERHTEPR